MEDKILTSASSDHKIMKRTIIVAMIFLSLLVLDTMATDLVQQEMATGTVVMELTQQGVSFVTITVDNQKEIVSDAKGNINFPKAEISSRPETVTAYKEGLEISHWEYEKGELTIHLREATMKTLEGILILNGKAIANQMIVLNGENDINFTTDANGHFSFKIGYDQQVGKNSEFMAHGIALKISDFTEFPSKALISLKLELPENTPKKRPARVKVIDVKQVPFKRTIVTISGESFITGSDGTFAVDNVSLKKEDWIIEGITPISINSSNNSNMITVVLPRSSVGNPLAVAAKSNGNNGIVDTSKNAGQVDNILLGEINKLIEFYELQGGEIEKRNQKIAFLIDSLSNVTQLDVADRDEYLTQVDELNKSIGITSDDFDELKFNSIELIRRLKTLLLEQQETIKSIEIEKELQAITFRNDLLFVLSILGIASLLVVVLVFIARRISARKKVVERVKNQLAEAQDIAKIASMTYFFKSKQHEYSDHFFNFLGIEDEKRIKKMQRTTDQYIHDELLQKDELEIVNDAVKKSLETKESLFMEIKVLSDNNTELFVDLRAKIEQNSAGKPVAISSTLQDVTEKKEREIQLIEAKTIAEKANQDKEDFLSTMSHEIRTPLNGIVGLTDHLMSSQPPKHLVENLKTLKFSADHLLSLVNDVLDYNKIQAGKMVLANTTFNLKEHMINAVKAMSLIALHKEIKLELDFQEDIPHMVKGDKVRLNQVISNLLNNAVKFTDKGGVKLVLKSVEGTAEKVNLLFSVKDTGIGIESSKLDKIFESFEQEDVTTSNKYGGTGLGLAISRQLVKLFGGELSVKSQQGEGSEFYFTIPFNKITEKDVMQHQNGISQLHIDDFSKLKILCVEDNEVNQLVISQYFENWKINYSFAATGAEALDKFRKESYDIVFMDINLPDQKGNEVVVKMKDEFPNTHCAFVALTAESSDSLKDVLIESGITGYLNKPFSKEELKSIVGKYGNKIVSI